MEQLANNCAGGRTRPPRLGLSQLTGAGGAQVTGIDLSRTLNARSLQKLRQALQQYLVLVVPDQPLDDSALAALIRQLGRFGEEPFVEGLETHPNVIAIIKEADEKMPVNFGGNWHSDWSFLARPPSYTLLHARELPPYGGDTLNPERDCVIKAHLEKVIQPLAA